MSKLTRLFAVLSALAILPSGLLAQATGTVTGRVTAEGSGAPLSGVQVAIQGTVRGTLTDQNGEYTITGVPVGQQVVDASVINRASGNQTVTVAAGQTVTANFQLASTALELEGIVVNAITGREERKREVGANVSTIQVDDINKGPITKIADVLTGRTAGVTLQGVAGTTGTSQRIRIRGANSLSLSNEPLIYVDGVLFNNSTAGIGVGGQDFSRLNDLNPEDIENIEVLKGPAASALYGTAAANGVLLITTRKGRSGAPVWRTWAEASIIEDRVDYPSNFLALQVDSAGAPVFIEEGFLNTAAVSLCPNYLAATGECRQEELLSFSPLEDRRTTPFEDGSRRKLGLSVSGGGEDVTYYFSGETSGENGVIDFNTLDQVNLRANLTAAVTDKFTIQLTSGYTDSNVVLNANDNNIFSPLINGLLGSAFFIPNADTLGTPGSRPGFGFGYSIDDISEIRTTQEVDRFIVGLNGTYNPLSWLTANANVGLDYTNRFDFETLQPGVLPIGGSFTLGFRDSRRRNDYLYTTNASATGTFDLRDNLVSTSTLGASYLRELGESTECFGAGLVAGTRSCASTSSLFSVDEDFFEVITIGTFFQQQFAISDRLFLAASVRADDNSAFGQDFGTILYPSANISWVVAEEPWFPELDFLSTLRLRAAYGTSGLRPNFRDAVTLFAPVSVTVGGEDVAGVTIDPAQGGVLGNVDLEPERSTEYEIGFESGLFNDRLSAEFTYYNKQSDDALIRRRLPPSLGLAGDVFANLGEIRNSGTEVALNARVLEFPNAQVNFRVSATTLDNEVAELGQGVEPIFFNRGNQGHIEGYAAGSFFQRPYTFEDANGDGLISRSEVMIDTAATLVTVRNVAEDGTVMLDTLNVAFMGESLPTNSQAFSADITLFKFLNITTLFERRAGHKQLNFTENFRCRVGLARGTGVCPAVANPNASLEAQAAFVATRFLGTNAGYIEDADFVKWRELAVRLGVPTFLSRTLPALEGASVTFAGRNLATWTDYSGLDPEINETGGDSNFTQGEFNTQPPVTYYTVRFDFTF